MPNRIRVTVWGENVHERKDAIVAKVYFHSVVRRVLPNAVHWAAPEARSGVATYPNISIKKTREKLVAKGPRLHKANRHFVRHHD